MTREDSIKAAMLENAAEYDRLADDYIKHAERYRGKTSNGRAANLYEAAKYAGLAATARRNAEGTD